MYVRQAIELRVLLLLLLLMMMTVLSGRLLSDHGTLTIFQNLEPSLFVEYFKL